MSDRDPEKHEPEDELQPLSPEALAEAEIDAAAVAQTGMGLPAHFRSGETQALVDNAQAGDVDSLNELFSRYYAYMLDLARRRLGQKLKSKEEADDLAQTTFREAARDFKQYRYRGQGSLLRWLQQILKNKIRDKAEYYSAGKRDMSRERPVDEPRPDADPDGPRFDAANEGDLSVTRQVQREEEFQILREALEDLSPDHRRAITLVFFQGMTLREAGQLMGGRTEDAVRMLLRRAESRLREITRVRLTKP